MAAAHAPSARHRARPRHPAATGRNDVRADVPARALPLLRRHVEPSATSSARRAQLEIGRHVRRVPRRACTAHADTTRRSTRGTCRCSIRRGSARAASISQRAPRAADGRETMGAACVRCRKRTSSSSAWWTSAAARSDARAAARSVAPAHSDHHGLELHLSLSAAARIRSRTMSPDDVRGEPAGHFVVLTGYRRRDRRRARQRPYLKHSTGGHHYWVNIDRLINRSARNLP